jgi:hypothetical protein
MTLRGRRRFIVPRGSHVNGNAIKLILLVIIGAWLGGAAPAPVEVDVTMVDYRFVPDHLSLRHGVHYACIW